METKSDRETLYNDLQNDTNTISDLMKEDVEDEVLPIRRTANRNMQESFNS